METPVRRTGRALPGIRPLPVLGGHLALDFANTVDDPLGPAAVGPRRRLSGAAPLGGRARPRLPGPARGRRGTAGRGRRRGAPRRRAARRAERHVRRRRRRRPVDEAWARLRPFSVDALARMHLAADLSPEWDGTALDAPVWPVADAAHRLLRSADDLARLKRCAGLPVVVPRPLPQRQPPLVRDGRLRHPREDPPLRDQAGAAATVGPAPR